jgi:hypothetical protein
MRRVEVEVFSEATNCPVVRMPGRKFPGVVLQGDSLSILLREADDLCQLSAKGDTAELAEAARYLRNLLSDYLKTYEETMRAHGLELPYTRKS